MAEFSFDLVSELDHQLLANTLNTTSKEIATRYDFRGSAAEIVEEKEQLLFKAEDDYKVGAMIDMFSLKAIKQGLDLKFFDFSEGIESALGGACKKAVKIKNGISKEKAKEVTTFIKGSGVKVNAQIQGEVIRVASKSKDDLQKAIQELKATDFGIAISFKNFR